MSPEEEKEVSNYEDARHLAYIAVWSVDLQVKRLKDEELDDFVLRYVADFHFLIVALIRIRRAAELVNRASNIKSALVQFDNDVPNLRKMRDVLEHIDDYAGGTGRDTNVAVGGLYSFTFGDTISWSEYELNLQTALKASHTLFEEIKANPPASYIKLVAENNVNNNISG